MPSRRAFYGDLHHSIDDLKYGWGGGIAAKGVLLPTFMENAPIIAETASLLQQNWGLPMHAADSWEKLRLALEPHIAYLLLHDFNTLVNAMYRLDVPDTRFRAALALSSPDLVASTLTQAVLDRERQRAETRLRYRSASNTTPTDER